MDFLLKGNESCVGRFLHHPRFLLIDAGDYYPANHLEGLFELNVAEAEGDVLDEDAFLPQVLIVGLELVTPLVFVALDYPVEHSMLGV